MGSAGTLEYAKAMYWEYLPDGLLRAHVDQERQRALYSYDQNGNRVQALEATGIVSPGQTPLAIDLSYNSLDELTKVRTPKPGASGTYLATLLSYDLHGNTEQLTDNREEDGTGSPTAAGRVFAYTYNAADQTTAQTDDFSTSGQTDDEQILYTYKPTGELDTQTLQKRPSGSWVNEQSSERMYFDNGLLKTLMNKNGAGTAIESHTQSFQQAGVYQNGNRASDIFLLKGPDTAAACYTNACTQSWVYDAQERVTHENPGTGAATLFTLDVQGNVPQEAAGTATTTRTFSGQQLVTEDFSTGTDKRYLYDALGSVDCVVKLAYSGTSCPAAGLDRPARGQRLRLQEPARRLSLLQWRRLRLQGRRLHERPARPSGQPGGDRLRLDDDVRLHLRRRYERALEGGADRRHLDHEALRLRRVRLPRDDH